MKEQPLSAALREFARQTGIQIAIQSQLTEGKTAPGLTGKYEPAAALAALLQGTGLVAYPVNENTYGIRVGDSETSAAVNAAQAGAIAGQLDSDLQLAQADQNSQSQSSQSSKNPPSEVSSETSDGKDQEIVVTGTNIRNVRGVFSPVTSSTREEMDRAGLRGASDFIARLPQNFGGGASPDRAAGSSSGIGAAGVNLRGLGTEATLVLLNGRRLAPSGLLGSYVDTAAIPTAALERVDILTDGASAIYGSDAVAGVVNFILRKDYSGAETRLRAGGATDGSGNSYQVGQTLGYSGERGRLLFSYEYLTEDALDANDRPFSRILSDPNDILPSNKRNSAFFSGALPLGERAEVFSDIYYNRRKSRQIYDFVGDRRRVLGDVEESGGTVGVAVDVAGDWRAEISSGLADGDFVNDEFTMPTIPGFGGATNESATQIRSVDGKLDGTLLNTAGGAVRGVIGAQYREEKHKGRGFFFDENGVHLAGFDQSVADTSREVGAAFVEFYVPLVGAGNARPGVRSLALSLAGRYEDYSDFGTTFNPKFGVLWSPAAGFNVRGTYGTSFRAPRLQLLVDNIDSMLLVDYIDPEVPGGQSVGLVVVGQRSDLDAEESSSWTAGFDWMPGFAPNFSLRATYFDIEYTGKVAFPSSRVDSSTFRFFDHPLPVQRNITPAQVQAFIDASTIPLFNYTTVLPSGSQSDVSDITILIDSRFTNASISTASGLDVTLDYELPAAGGAWQFELNGSYLVELNDQFSLLRPVVEKTGTIFNPSKLRVRGSTQWSSGASSAGLFVNYVDSYADNQSLGPARPVDSWLTLDASYRYDLGQHFSTGLLAGSTLTFSVLNIFDEDPPRIALTTAPGNLNRFVTYDTANADPQGRVAAIQFTKQWKQ